MTTMPSTHSTPSTDPYGHEGGVPGGHAHHPNYILIFVWLVILTFIEVMIPEVIQLPKTGPDPSIQAVSPITKDMGKADDADTYTRIAAAMAPSERADMRGKAAKVVTLTGLAIAKALLVALFFMHLRFDGWKLIAIISTPTVLFLVIMIMTAPDIAVSWPTVYWWLESGPPTSGP